MTAVSLEARLHHTRSLRPSYLRSQPLVMPGRAGRFGEKARAVIDALNAGHSLGAAARIAGTAKSTARIIRLRAKRNGLLNAKAVRAIAAAKRKSQRDNARGELLATRRRYGL